MVKFFRKIIYVSSSVLQSGTYRELAKVQYEPLCHFEMRSKMTIEKSRFLTLVALGSK